MEGQGSMLDPKLGPFVNCQADACTLLQALQPKKKSPVEGSKLYIQRKHDLQGVVVAKHCKLAR